MSDLRRAAFFSVFLHLVIVCVLLAPTYHHKSVPPIPRRAFMVDFVKVGPKSAAPSLGIPKGETSKYAPKVQQKKAPPPAPKHEAKKTPEAPKAPAAKSPLKPKAPAAKPAPAKKKPVAAAPKKSAPSKDPKTKSATHPAKKNPPAKKGSTAQTRGKVNLEKKKASASSITDLMGKIPNAQKNADHSALAETFSNELTGTDIDLLNRHMKRFWNLPSGHEKASDIVVEVELFIDPDGAVERAQIVDTKRLQSDNEYRIAAESALRAVLDPECSPLPLDPQKYEQWKHMIFVFDPKEMCH